MGVIAIPGQPQVTLRHLVLDVNGTLSARGELIDGVAKRLARLAEHLELHVASADTFGTAEALAASVGAAFTLVADGGKKERLVRELGGDTVVAVGNGRNDAAMFRAARLSIAVIGPEGAAVTALQAADVVCRDIGEALDLLLDDRALLATLRP